MDFIYKCEGLRTGSPWLCTVALSLLNVFSRSPIDVHTHLRHTYSYFSYNGSVYDWNKIPL
jgi:hypothetical protein